jgi:hypothetical protein
MHRHFCKTISIWQRLAGSQAAEDISLKRAVNGAAVNNANFRASPHSSALF